MSGRDWTHPLIHSTNTYVDNDCVAGTISGARLFGWSKRKCDYKARWRALLCDTKLILKGSKDVSHNSHTTKTEVKLEKMISQGADVEILQCLFLKDRFQPFVIHFLQIDSLGFPKRQEGEGCYSEVSFKLFWTSQCGADSSPTAVCVWKISEPASWSWDSLGVHRDKRKYFQI